MKHECLLNCSLRTDLIPIFPEGNPIGQLPDDFFSEFTKIKDINLDDTHLNVWPNFQEAHELITFKGNDLFLNNDAPDNLGEITE